MCSALLISFVQFRNYVPLKVVPLFWTTPYMGGMRLIQLLRLLVMINNDINTVFHLNSAIKIQICHYLSRVCDMYLAWLLIWEPYLIPQTTLTSFSVRAVIIPIYKNISTIVISYCHFNDMRYYIYYILSYNIIL